MLSRLVFLALEVAAWLAAIWRSGSSAGSYFNLAFVLAGALGFRGWGCWWRRTRTIEGMSGLMNILLPMWLLSGTFFSGSLPLCWPFIKALPLTALNTVSGVIRNLSISASGHKFSSSIVGFTQFPDCAEDLSLAMNNQVPGLYRGGTTGSNCRRAKCRCFDPVATLSVLTGTTNRSFSCPASVRRSPLRAWRPRPPSNHSHLCSDSVPRCQRR